MAEHNDFGKLAEELAEQFLVEIFFQDSPPSLDLKIPDDAPLSTNFHVLRSLCQSVA